MLVFDRYSEIRVYTFLRPPWSVLKRQERILLKSEIKVRTFTSVYRRHECRWT